DLWDLSRGFPTTSNCGPGSSTTAPNPAISANLVRNSAGRRPQHSARPDDSKTYGASTSYTPPSYSKRSTPRTERTRNFGGAWHATSPAESCPSGTGVAFRRWPPSWQSIKLPTDSFSEGPTGPRSVDAFDDS